MPDEKQDAPAENEALETDQREESVAGDNHDYGEGFDVFATEVPAVEPEQATDKAPETSQSGSEETDEPGTQEGDAASGDDDGKTDDAPAIPEEAQKAIDGLNAALLAEREKKRDAQIALEALRSSQAQQPPKEEKKDDGFNWDNPEETIARVKAEIRQENQTNMLNMSEAQAKARHTDYDAKYEKFVGMAQENPALVQRMLDSPDPAEFAYQEASKKISADEIGADPAAYKAKLKAEILAELKAEKTEKTIKEVTTLPPSADAIKGKIAQDNAPIIHDDPLGALWNDPDR